METKAHTPSFTVSLRGYDREEVDHYLDSLSEALGQVDDTEEHNRRLQAHINRLNNRIKELEDRPHLAAPTAGMAVGEKIGTLLQNAEEAAAETISRAEATAARIVELAEARQEEAEAAFRTAVSGGEEEARRIEADARVEAADIISEAEARATARTRQIEQWADQVISHTRAEEARLLRQQHERRKAAADELESLAAQRSHATSTLEALRDALNRTLASVAPAEPDAQAPPPAGAPLAERRPDEEGGGASPHDASDTAVVEQGVVTPAEAWVSGGSPGGAQDDAG